MDGDSLHQEMTKVFRALRPPSPNQVIFGQYEGYRDEAGVAPDSDVETFVAMEVHVDDWTWIGVPFYLRTGKALAQVRRTITVGFKEPSLEVIPGSVDGTCSARQENEFIERHGIGEYARWHLGLDNEQGESRKGPLQVPVPRLREHQTSFSRSASPE
jgi:glucose-6-phosphate 1-dehydrogenase